MLPRRIIRNGSGRTAIRAARYAKAVCGVLLSGSHDLLVVSGAASCSLPTEHDFSPGQRNALGLERFRDWGILTDRHESGVTQRL